MLVDGDGETALCCYDCCVSKFHEMFHDCDNSKETFLSRDFFQGLGQSARSLFSTNDSWTSRRARGQSGTSW